MREHPAFEELSALADHRLGEVERRRLEEHLAGCDACRGAWDRLISTRQALRRSADPTEEVPESLRAAVGASLDREQRRPRFEAVTRLAVALAAAAVIVFGILVWQRGKPDLPEAAMQHQAAIASGQRALEMRTTDAAALERWFNQQLDFSTRVFDLKMMRYDLVGGRIDSLKGRRSALFVYRHESGEVVVCEMYEGRTDLLPGGATRRLHKDIEFFIYERDGATTVFWQEGALSCVLAGRGSRDEILSLAFAKAMKAAA